MEQHPSKRIDLYSRIITLILCIPIVAAGIYLIRLFFSYAETTNNLGFYIIGIIAALAAVALGQVLVGLWHNVMLGFAVIVDKMEQWKPESAMKTVEKPVNPEPARNWECSCGYRNDKRAVFCENCGKHK